MNIPITIVLKSDGEGESTKAVGGIRFDPVDSQKVTLTSNMRLEEGEKYHCLLCDNVFPSLSLNFQDLGFSLKSRFLTIQVVNMIENKKNHCFKYIVKILK